MRFALLTSAVMVVMEPWGFPLVRAQETGNSLVSCAACQNVKVQDWSCEAKCLVTKGNSGK